jgi:hypothetical protein
MPDNPNLDVPALFGRGTRPNNRFRALCNLAGIQPKTSIETGEQCPWVLKDLRKTCATLRRAHAGVIHRDSWTLRRRDHVPSLRPSRRWRSGPS